MMVEELPNPFVFTDGSRVRAPQDWTRRREELRDLFLRYEYGPLPPAGDMVVAIQLLAHRHETLEVLHEQHKLFCGPRGTVSFTIDLLIPPAGEEPFPVILVGDWGWAKANDDIARQILQRGYILAEFNRVEVAPDNDGFRACGVLAAHPELKETGALAAWAWGFHCCVDFLMTLPIIDQARIAITGHSRGGKAALLAGATDVRIALVAPNGSGCGGTGCHRIGGPQRERLANILTKYAFWFSPQLKAFIGEEHKLPFDQHQLKALCAPRALLDTQALDDLWANPQGALVTHRAAKEVYQFLGCADRIGIHFRPGGHSQGGEDFAALLDFADSVFFNRKRNRDFDADPWS